MNENYWIYEDSFIFKPEFNEPIDGYIQVIKNYNKLIFSNYNDLEICIRTNNKYFDKYYNNYIKLTFNKSLANSFDNLTSLTCLTFGHTFNQSLANSLDNLTSLTCLTFGHTFNQSLANFIR